MYSVSISIRTSVLVKTKYISERNQILEFLISERARAFWQIQDSGSVALCDLPSFLFNLMKILEVLS